MPAGITEAERRLPRYMYEAETAFLHDYQEIYNNQSLGTAIYETPSSASGGGIDCVPWSNSFYFNQSSVPGCAANDWCSNPIPVCASASCSAGEIAYSCTGHGANCHGGNPTSIQAAYYTEIGTCN